MDTGGGGEPGAEEAAGPNVGVEVSDRRSPREHGGNDDRLAKRWHEDRANQGHRGADDPDYLGGAHRGGNQTLLGSGGGSRLATNCRRQLWVWRTSYKS